MPAKPYVWNGVDTWMGVGVANIPVSSGTNSRDSLVYGDYKPDATTTGPLPGTTLTQFGNNSTSTDYVVSQNNEVVEKLEIWGRVNLGSYTNVTVKNCIIHGTLNRGVDTAHVVANGDNLGGALIIDCKLMGRSVTIPATFNGVAQPDAGTVNDANEWCGGIRGANYTIRRTEITNTADGISLTKLPGNVTIEGCWIHNGWMNEWDSSRGSASGSTASTAKFYPYSTGTQNYTHVDGIQFHIGKNYRIVGNVIGGTRVKGDHNVTPSQKDAINSGDDMYNSALMIKQEVNNSTANKIENVLIDKNWIAGGVASVNMTLGKSNYFESVYVTNNRFMRSTWGSQSYILRMQDANGVKVGNFSGNVFEDDGSAVPISNGGTATNPDA